MNGHCNDRDNTYCINRIKSQNFQETREKKKETLLILSMK